MLSAELYDGINGRRPILRHGHAVTLSGYGQSPSSFFSPYIQLEPAKPTQVKPRTTTQAKPKPNQNATRPPVRPSAGPQGRRGGGEAGSRSPSVQDLQRGGLQVCANSLLGFAVLLCAIFRTRLSQPQCMGVLVSTPFRWVRLAEYFWPRAALAREDAPAAHGSVPGIFLPEAMVVGVVLGIYCDLGERKTG